MADMIVETGAIVAGANSLVSLEFADDYFASHPFYSDNWSSLSVPKKKALLMYATAQLGGLVEWGGTPARATQTLAWPRYGVLDPFGTYYSITTIPTQLKQAICEQAYWLSTPDGNPDKKSASAGLEELKLDVIQLRFGGSDVRTAVPVAVRRLLKGLTTSYFGSRVRRVQVGL